MMSVYEMFGEYITGELYSPIHTVIEVLDDLLQFCKVQKAI